MALLFSPISTNFQGFQGLCEMFNLWKDIMTREEEVGNISLIVDCAVWTHCLIL